MPTLRLLDAEHAPAALSPCVGEVKRAIIEGVKRFTFPAPHTLNDVLTARRLCACEVLGLEVDESHLDMLSVVLFAARHMTEEARSVIRFNTTEAPARAGAER